MKGFQSEFRCTELRANVLELRNYAELHVIVRNCAELHAIVLNCMQLCGIARSLQSLQLHASKIHMCWKPYLHAKMTIPNSQQHPEHHYLITTVEDIVVFLSLKVFNSDNFSIFSLQ